MNKSKQKGPPFKVSLPHSYLNASPSPFLPFSLNLTLTLHNPINTILSLALTTCSLIHLQTTLAPLVNCSTTLLTLKSSHLDLQYRQNDLHNDCPPLQAALRFMAPDPTAFSRTGPTKPDSLIFDAPCLSISFASRSTL
jgi:hypothetical protein